MAKTHRKGPEAEFWADPAADPRKLCQYLTFWPHNTDVLCIAARKRIAADNGIDLATLFDTGKVDTTPEAPLFAEAPHA